MCKYEFSDISGHTVVISRKTVKYAENTICNTCAMKPQRYEFSEIQTHTVVISGKTIK